jgi:lactate racemase
MRTKLAYGKTHLEVNLPDQWDITIVEPQHEIGLADPVGAVQDALKHPLCSRPLSELVAPHHQIGIVINDITRATPTQILVQALTDELRKVIPDDQTTIFVALGTHRENTEAELRSILGDELYNSFSIVQNNAFDKSTQLRMGKTRLGHEIWINRALADCNLLILTGFIEPHFFAGFSGGGKAIMPGMGGLETIMDNHSARMVADPSSTWGHTRGNPIWEEIQEISDLFNTFLVNVTMNHNKEITRVFAGDLKITHQAGSMFAKQLAMVPVAAPFDIVLTSNSGYPLDLNLYQAVKGMSAAAKIVKNEGIIIIAAECWDGIPEHGHFASQLCGANSPTDLIKTIQSPGFRQQDQWQTQVLAQILLKAEIYVHSKYLSDAQLESLFLRPARDLNSVFNNLSQRFDSQPRVCVLPQGPLTIPYVKSSRYPNK